MRKFKLLAFVAVALATIVIGCRPESVGPSTNKKGPGKAVRGPHDCIYPYCNQVDFKLVDADFHEAGIVTIGNDNTDLSLCLNAYYGNMQDVWVWAGNEKAIVPLTTDGIFDVAKFPYQKGFDPTTGMFNSLTVPVSLAKLWSKCQFAVVARVYSPAFTYEYDCQLDSDGDAIPGTCKTATMPEKWTMITAVNNSYTTYNAATFNTQNALLLNFDLNTCDLQNGSPVPTCQPWQCATTPCNPSQNKDCGDIKIVCDACNYIVPGVAGLTDATLQVEGIIGGQAPYTYSWVKMGTTAVLSTTNTLKVTPSATTEYKVTVTDANGLSAFRVMRVTAVNAACSNNSKVKVCYAPPSNPNSWVEACVAPKDAGDFVPKLRYTGGGSLKRGSGGSNKAKVKGSKKQGSMHAAFHAGSIKYYGSHKVSSKKPNVNASHKPKPIKTGGSKVKAGSKMNIKSKAVKNGGGVGSIKGSLGPCGSNGPVTPDNCGLEN